MLKTKLLKHQQTAFDKLSQYVVGALFMDMGTGKTRTTLSFIEKLINENKIKDVLWVCPYSVKHNLKDDIEKHSDLYNIIYIVGMETISSSDSIYLKLYNYIESSKHKTMIVLDESHMIKNPRAIRTKRMLQLSNLVKYKLILTGTKTPNGIEDLWSQFYFLHPNILGFHSFYSFANHHILYSEKFKNVVDERKNVDELLNKIEPYTFQVEKSECFDLPAKTYKLVEFDLSHEQLEQYEAEKMYTLNTDKELTSYDIFNLFTTLRTICSGYIHRKNKDLIELYNERVKVLNDVLTDIDIVKNKVIIFYNFEYDRNCIEKMLNSKNITYSVLNGSLTNKEKSNNILTFKENNSILLTNIKSGAHGLNLQFTNYIVFYNNCFNYAKRIQAEDRCHRHGQDKNVHIIDIISSGSIEHRIMNAIENKEDLSSMLSKKLKTLQDNDGVKNWIKEL